MTPMRVFGIDPGSNATGYAVVSRHHGTYQLHEAGVIRTKSEDPVPGRLLKIYTCPARLPGRPCSRARSG